MKLNPVLCPPSDSSASGSGHYVICSRYLAGKSVTGILADSQLIFPGDSTSENAVMPVLTYRSSAALESMLATIVTTPPDDRQVDSDLGAEYQFWLVRDPQQASALQSALDGVDAFYWTEGWSAPLQQQADVLPADHHQTSPVLLLSDDQLEPRACHRLLADLGGMDDYDFLQKLQKCFNISVAADAAQAMPTREREMGLYVGGHWYRLRLIEGTWFAADPVRDTDIGILYDNVFALMLDIRQPDDAARTAAVDPVLTPDLLAELVDQGDWQAVFVLFPPRVESLMNISDAGGRLPYRTVEFEQPLPWMPY